MDDLKLLRVYVAQDSQEAFRTVVERHLNLVFSTALRKTGDATLAEEVAQAVFILLSRKAATMSSQIILSGWLYRATCYVANDALKAERRRQQREQEMYDHMQTDASAQTWTSIEPLLDDAMAALSEPDRQAILLRFFENKSLTEVGDALRVSDDTAQKRISRALSKLKGYFERRNVAVTIGVVAALMVDHATQAAPAHLLSSVTQAVWNDSLPASTTALVSNAAISFLRAKQWSLLRRGFAVGAGIAIVGSLFLNSNLSDPDQFKPAVLNSSHQRSSPSLRQNQLAETAPKVIATPLVEDKRAKPQPSPAAKPSSPTPAPVLVKTAIKPGSAPEVTPPPPSTTTNPPPLAKARPASPNTRLRPVTTASGITGAVVAWNDNLLTNTIPPRELQPVEAPRRQPVNRAPSRPDLFGTGRSKRSGSNNSDGKDLQ